MRLSEREHNLIIELMCIYDPSAVYRYLLGHNEYQPQHCLNIVKSHGLCDAHALLLEKIGDFSGALGVSWVTGKFSDFNFNFDYNLF